MHANTGTSGGGGGGGGSWRLPPDETLQVQDPKDKLDVSSVFHILTQLRNENELIDTVDDVLTGKPDKKAKLF